MHHADETRDEVRYISDSSTQQTTAAELRGRSLSPPSLAYSGPGRNLDKRANTAENHSICVSSTAHDWVGGSHRRFACSGMTRFFHYSATAADPPASGRLDHLQQLLEKSAKKNHPCREGHGNQRPTQLLRQHLQRSILPPGEPVNKDQPFRRAVIVCLDFAPLQQVARPRYDVNTVCKFRALPIMVILLYVHRSQHGAAVVYWLDYASPTKANRV
ncbi:hypothetical protein PR048_032107 [Dryococelus australis]|uniref:Uncharacterized protein n=1 Tax=Dryococelus australis TaxID=614101 RepID=A0ABQ9G5D7_9NEOP|nr:hypothetical protein PR048_032107 [Dryococelus australis]